MTDTTATTGDMLAALRIVSPAGQHPDVDAALEQAQVVVESGVEAVAALEQAVLESTPTTGTEHVAALLEGRMTADELILAATRPQLETSAASELLLAVERHADRRARAAAEDAADALPLSWAADALAGPYGAWQDASRTLAGLLEQHGVDHLDTAAMLAAPPAVPNAWRKATTAAHACLDRAAVVAVVEGDAEHGPTSNYLGRQDWTPRWWTPDPDRHLDPVARAAAVLAWDPSAVALELLPAAADGPAGMTFGLVGWVDATRRRLTWERTTEARSEVRAATARAHAYGRDGDRELDSDGRARDVVERARTLDDGLPTTRTDARRRAA